MTGAQQPQTLTDSISHLRHTLDEIEQVQADADSLRALTLAELIGDWADSILWSATAVARQVPGTTRTVIGGRLGISRQAAHQRLGSVG